MTLPGEMARVTGLPRWEAGLGNRALVGTVNANREHFEMGVRDLALCEAMYAGWLARMLTHKVTGLENYAQVFDILENSAKYGAIKTYFEVRKI